MNLPTDPRLPIIYDENIKPLTQRLYELFRQIFTSIKDIEYSINPIRLMSSFVNASENYFFDGSTANQLKLKKGTPEAPGIDVMTVDAAGKVAFPQNVQTWQNMLGVGGRALGATITNTTGQKIEVIATLQQSGAGTNNLKATIAGIPAIYGSTSSAISTGSTLSFSVPAGATYIIDTVNAATILTWLELR